MNKYKCIATYKHNQNCIVPVGAIVDVEPDDNQFMVLVMYKGRNMKLNWTTIRKYFTEYTNEYLQSKGYTTEEINAMNHIERMELTNKLIQMDKRRDEK